MRGHDEKRKVTNDKQSRSSRGKKSVVSGRVAEGQKLVFEFILVCQRRVILHYSKTHYLTCSAVTGHRKVW